MSIFDRVRAGQNISPLSGGSSGGGGGSSVLTTKGDILSFSTVAARLGVGTDGQVLTADSAQTLGVKWSTISASAAGVTNQLQRNLAGVFAGANIYDAAGKISIASTGAGAEALFVNGAIWSSGSASSFTTSINSVAQGILMDHDGRGRISTTTGTNLLLNPGGTNSLLVKSTGVVQFLVGYTAGFATFDSSGNISSTLSTGFGGAGYSSLVLTSANLTVSGTPTGVGSVSGGTMTAGNHFVKIMAVDANGYLSTAGTESAAVVTTGSTSSVAWSWTAVANAVSYRIYVSKVSNSYAAYYTSSTNSFSQTADTSGSTAGTTSNGPTIVRLTTPDIATGPGTVSQNLLIKSGDNSWTTGDVTVQPGGSGGSTATPGTLRLLGGTNTHGSSGSGGDVVIAGGGGPTGTGSLTVTAGVISITAGSTLTLTTANAGSNTSSAGVVISSGTQSGTASTGGLSFKSGNSNTGPSGSQTISSGDASGGATGDVILSTGTVSQNLGAFGQKGKLKFQPGNEGLANLPWGATSTDGSSAWSNSINLNALVVGQSYLPTPSGTPTGVGAGVNGALTAGTHYVRIVAVDGFGNKTLASTESAAITTSGSASLIRWTWSNVPGADHYEVWVTKVSGSYASFFATTDRKPQFLQTGDTGTAGTLPVAVTGGYLQLDGLTSGNIKFQAADATTSYSVKMPSAQGTGALTNDGAGNLTWTSGGSGANTDLSNIASVQIPNATGLFWRNAANSANIPGITVDAVDRVVIGDTTGPGAYFEMANGNVQIYTSNAGGGKSVQFSADIIELFPYGDNTAVPILFYGDNGNWMAVKAPPVVTANKTIMLPDGVGVDGDVLRSNGANPAVLEWGGLFINAPQGASDPAGAVAGSVYFNTGTLKLKVYNGTTWETITSV